MFTWVHADSTTSLVSALKLLATPPSLCPTSSTCAVTLALNSSSSVVMREQAVLALSVLVRMS